MTAPCLLYDFNSPYAYLAFARAEAVLGPGVELQPVALAFMLRAHDRTPWSLTDEETRAAGMRQCEQRAERYGLPALRWPPDWPVGSYALAPLRAALVARGHGALRAFSQAAFARHFADGLPLTAPEDLDVVALAAGLDPAVVRAGVEDPAIKQALTDATRAALDLGAVGVPTTVVGDALFWGDDRLEDAAAA
ncbi:2-hydroxychromene-2-carboxylate isomerase [Baekduia soli]|uniref:2-hydroxychromene-2-carboxylate isomerase n=1 Tax=Baekduia soli TaxID=496014 RepID=UPI001E56B19B|nr:DsbA family protein [Baekduia soli]